MTHILLFSLCLLALIIFGGKFALIESKKSDGEKRKKNTILRQLGCHNGHLEGYLLSKDQISLTKIIILG